MERVYSIQDIFDIIRRDSKKYWELYRFERFQWKYFENSGDTEDVEAVIERLAEIIEDEERHNPGQTYKIAVMKSKQSNGKDKDRLLTFKAVAENKSLSGITQDGLTQVTSLLGYLKQNDLVPGFLYKEHLMQNEELKNKEAQLNELKMKLLIQENNLKNKEEELKRKEQELDKEREALKNNKWVKVSEIALGSLIEKKVIPYFEGISGLSGIKKETQPDNSEISTEAERLLNDLMNEIYAYTGEDLSQIRKVTEQIKNLLYDKVQEAETNY